MDYAKASGPMPLKVHWYEGVAGLKQLRTEWQELTTDAHLFSRYEWHLAAAEHLLGVGHSIYFCRIGDHEGRPVAIIPGLTSTSAVKLFGRLPAFALGWSDQLALSDFPLAAGADVFEIGKVMLKAFGDHRFKWRVVSWPRVMADSNAAKVALAIGVQRADIVSTSVCNTFYTSNAGGKVSDLDVFSVKSGKLRRNLAHRWRRLEQQGPIEMRSGRERGNVEKFFEEFLRIESSGWKGDKGTRTALAQVPAARAFYNALLAESNSEFETDVALLYCGDRAVAGQFLIRAARWLHIYKMGYDEEFANCSPGQLLTQLVIERAKASCLIDRVSLVTGLDWHKDWKPIAEPTLQINIFRHMWRPSLIRCGRHLLAEFKQLRSRPAVKSTVERDLD
jgi:CelD/BcsL family acetyltransferase involved in cellulose biosynthesis